MGEFFVLLLVCLFVFVFTSTFVPDLKVSEQSITCFC